MKGSATHPADLAGLREADGGEHHAGRLEGHVYGIRLPHACQHLCSIAVAVGSGGMAAGYQSISCGRAGMMLQQVIAQERLQGQFQLLPCETEDVWGASTSELHDSEAYLLSLEPHDLRDGPAFRERAGVREGCMRQVQQVLQVEEPFEVIRSWQPKAITRSACASNA